MKKIVILGILFVVVLVILILSFFISKSGSSIQSLMVINTVPDQNAVNVPRSQNISFTFNQPITADEFKIFVSPDTKITSSIAGDTLQIKAEPSWEAGSKYRITVQYADLSKLPAWIDFTTEGPPTNLNPNTAPDPTSILEYEEHEREINPALYLSNKTPYAQEEFTITSDFDKSLGKFVFIVEISEGVPEADGKKATYEWVKSLGLTDSQIQSFAITYLQAQTFRR